MATLIGTVNLIMNYVLMSKEVMVLEIEQGKAKNKSTVSVFWKNGCVHMWNEKTSFIDGEYGIADACDKLREVTITKFEVKRPRIEPGNDHLRELAQAYLSLGSEQSIKETMAVMDKMATEAINSLKTSNYKDENGNYTAWVHQIVSGYKIVDKSLQEMHDALTKHLFVQELKVPQPYMADNTIEAAAKREQVMRDYAAMVNVLEAELNHHTALEGRYFIDVNEASGAIGIFYREEVVG